MTDRVLGITVLFCIGILILMFRHYNPSALGQAANSRRTNPGEKQKTIPLTAAQITGTYTEGGLETLEVQALPSGNILFHFDGLWNINAPGGPSMDEITGILPLHQNRAFYTAKEGGERLLLRFAHGSVFISQDGYRGDPPSDEIMRAGGVCEKISDQTPRFK